MDYIDQLINGMKALGEIIGKVFERVEQLEKEIEALKRERDEV